MYNIYEKIKSYFFTSKFSEHEIKIVSEIIQPQGARVKPQDNLLISFGKACEVLKTDIIGSILISNLTTEVAWLILMVFFLNLFFISDKFKKTLYAIEYLIKNYPKYFKYFQTHKNFLINLNVPQEENQATHVKNLSNGIISILENQAKTEKPYQHDELLIKVFFN